MSKSLRATKRTSENYDGFLTSYAGKDVVKKINAIKSSKRYHKAYRSGDVEAQIEYENEIESLVGGSNFSYYEA